MNPFRNEDNDERLLTLSGTPGPFVLTTGAWGRVLALAQLYGWQPAGPAVRPDRPSPGHGGLDYLFTDDQRVTSRDCRDIAAALDRALPDIPEFDARLAGGDLSNLCVYFSGVGRLWLRALSAFCRAGSFFIRSAPSQPETSEGYRAA